MPIENEQQKAMYHKLKEQPVGTILKEAREDMDLEVYQVAHEMARSEEYILRVESNEYDVPAREITNYLEAIDRIANKLSEDMNIFIAFKRDIYKVAALRSREEAAARRETKTTA